MKRVIRSVIFAVVFLVLAGILFSVFPAPSEAQLEQELGDWLYRRTSRRGCLSDTFSEGGSFDPFPGLLIVAKLGKEDRWSEITTDPILLGWCEDGKWEKIEEPMKEVVNEYFDEYVGPPNLVWEVHGFEIQSIQREGLFYSIKYYHTWSTARLAGRGLKETVIRGPFGWWWFVIESSGVWVS